MQERAFAHDKIAFIWDTIVTDVQGDQKVTGLVLHNRRTNETFGLAVGGMFIAAPAVDSAKGDII
jgi:thioredoxin reductase (NADPH)